MHQQRANGLQNLAGDVPASQQFRKMRTGMQLAARE
jgi:hypothetical protein